MRSIKLIDFIFTNIETNESWKENFEELGIRCAEILKLGENCNDLRINSMIYYAIGEWYNFMGFYFTDDEIEQRKCIIKGVKGR